MAKNNKFKTFKDILLKKGFLSDVLSTASYGNPWFAFGTHTDTDTETYETAKALYTCREDIWAYVLIHGGFLLVEDVEEEKEFKLSLKDFERALKSLALNYPSQYAAIMDESGDLYDYDALIQVAVFKEVVYG